MGRVLERVSLFMLLVIIGLRPLISESYDSGGDGFSIGGFTDANPLTTLIIDTAVIAAACLWLLARATGTKARYRWCGIEIGALVVAVAGVVSCAFASNKRVAINATVDWLMLPLLTIVLANVMRRRWQIRLTLCVILATAAVQAWQCLDQVLGGFADTEKLYYEQREQLWQRRGIPLDSPTVELFERRLAAREATGFLGHPNVTGGYLAMCGLVAIGMSLVRWFAPPLPFRKGFAVVILLVSLVLLSTAWTTGSIGAVAAMIAGLTVLLVATWKRDWMAHNYRRVFVAGWAAVVLGGLGVAGFGWFRGGLPHPSLDFRWQYWTATARMIADHPWTGVGAGNFGDAYLGYKSIQSPEEVKNAHNFLVQAAADWGALGLIGMVLMLVGGTWKATQPDGSSAAPVPARGANECRTANGSRPGAPFAWAFVLALVIFLVRIPLLGSADVNFIVVSTVIPGMIWLVTFALSAIESDTFQEFLDDAMPHLATAINVALFAFLLQDTINFALLVPGAATTFFALLAVPIAMRSSGGDSKPAAPGGYRVSLVAALVLLGALLVGCVWPVAYAFSYRLISPGYNVHIPEWPLERQCPYVLYALAAEADPLDPVAPRELGLWLRSMGVQWVDPKEALRAAVRWTEEAIRRNPRSPALYRQLSAIHQDWARREDAANHLLAAADAERAVVAMYPQSPDAHVSLADRLVELGEATNDAGVLKEAVEHYRTGLALDDARPDWEVIRRFSESRRMEIEAQLDLATSVAPVSYR